MKVSFEKISTFFLFLLLFASYCTWGQQSFHTGMLLTEDLGLPGRYASAIAEDYSGFIWIGGPEGIARYDGMSFKKFSRNADNPNTLIDNRVRCLLADSTKLWIGTQNGLSILDLTTEKFSNIQFDSIGKRSNADMEIKQPVNALHKDANGNIWIGTAHWGAVKYDPATKVFSTLTIAADDIPKEMVLPERLATVLDFTNDIHDKDILWIGYYSGLMKMNTRTGKFKLYTFPFAEKEEQISRNAFRKIYQHFDGKIYIGAWFNVLQVFDPVTEQLESLPQEFITEQNMQTQAIREITKGPDSALWITSNMGVLIYDPLSKQYVGIWKNDDKENLIYGVDFVDSKGVIYSLQGEGLTLYDPKLQNFISASFAEMNPEIAGLAFDVAYDDTRREYLVCSGTSRGLYRFNARGIRWSEVPLPAADIKGNTSYNLRSISKLNDDVYVLASNAKLYYYHPALEKITAAPVNLPVEVPRIHNAFVDSKKNVWIATVHDGVLQWNTETGSIRKHNYPDDSEFGAGHEDTFFEDREGRIWIKCRNAFTIYDPAQDTIHYYEPEDLVTPFYTTFALDSRGNVWLASGTGWVGRVDLSAKGFISKRYTVSERQDGMMTFQIDKFDRLWCALNDKLVRVDTRTDKIDVFPYTPAMKASSLFSMRYINKEHLVFGAKDQIFIADLKRLSVNHPYLKPYPTQIDIREQPLVSDTVVHKLNILRLGPKDNFFSISFSALGGIPGQPYTFRYRLNGFQNEWIEVTDRRHANFTNVPSGQYLFQLQAAGATGEFSTETYSLPIEIAKPFFEKTWVRLLGIFLVVTFIQSIYRYRIHQVKKEEQLKTEFQQQLAMAETNALRAQMNPHFIFNSLNSIENYILKNDPGKAATYLNDFARLIRLILQNSRSKQIPLKTELDTLELYLEMEKLRFADKLEYSIQVDPGIHPEQIDIPPMLIQPYVENAIWHGLMPKPEGGRVNIELKQVENILHIIIEDNGIGREKSAEIQARKNQDERKSIGMTITRNRIELLNKIHETEASVRIIDMKDKGGVASGTRVEITIPV